jgi:hypothetical protein
MIYSKAVEDELLYSGRNQPVGLYKVMLQETSKAANNEL